MKSAIQTTALMGIMAAVAAVAAAWVYPWPKVVSQNAQINKPLIEDYDTSSVRGIEVVAFNEETSQVDRLRLKRKGERWVIPQKSEFDVTGGDRVIAVTKSLNGRTVLEVTSDSQTDHVKFGVVDPTDANTASTRSSLGVRFEPNHRPCRQKQFRQSLRACTGETNGLHDRVQRQNSVYRFLTVDVSQSFRTAVLTV